MSADEDAFQLAGVGCGAGGAPAWSEGVPTKSTLIVDYATELETQGIRATHGLIRAMLEAVGRNYRTSGTEISMALRRAHKSGKVVPYPNGQRVEVNGKVYRSIREAARKEGCAIETVRKRIRAGHPGWCYVDEVG